MTVLLQLAHSEASITKCCLALSPREKEVLQWAAEGKTEWEIGRILGLSEHTADKAIRSARSKLNASNRTQVIAQAIRLGLID
jgi:LuxR family quorum sensing-dependent transcriptional regulator